MYENRYTNKSLESFKPYSHWLTSSTQCYAMLCYAIWLWWQGHHDDDDEGDVVVVLLLAMAGRIRPPCLFSSPDFSDSETSVERGAPRFVKPSLKSGSFSAFNMWCLEGRDCTPPPLLSLDDGSIVPLPPPPDEVVVVCCWVRFFTDNDDEDEDDEVDVFSTAVR